MTPAERLRAAATRLREVTGGTTWIPECGRWWLPDLGTASVAEADVDVARARDERVAAYIAMMSPPVALALAKMLEGDAEAVDGIEDRFFEDGWMETVLAVADAVLGGERS